MKLRFWGTRSSIATPGMETCELGGNTSCIQLFLDDDRSLLLNSGTGIIEYAAQAVARSPRREFHILLSSLAWDFIQGFPFFGPIHAPGDVIHLYSPMPIAVMEENFVDMFDGSYSPLRNIANLNARLHFHSIPSEGLEIQGAQIQFLPTAYPGAAYAYRITTSSTTLACLLKHEHRIDPAPERLIDFIRGADLLIYDGQFTLEEYRARPGWGHSTIEDAIEVTREAGVPALLIASHDPSHSDSFLTMHLKRLKTRLDLRADTLPRVELAAENRLWEVSADQPLLELAIPIPA